MKILITGASGFIGQSLCKYLSKLGRSVRGTIRSNNPSLFDNDFEVLSVGDINIETDWMNALVDIDCVIHCAGRVHIMDERKNSYETYKSINVEGTMRLAEQAIKAGVKKFIYLSSIKVNGEKTNNSNSLKNYPGYKNKFSYDDKPNPRDAYAISKFEAEKILWKISSGTDLKLTILRLPLVYGYDAKGNLSKLVKLIKTRIPLPFKALKNKRSMIGIDNLIDLILKCIDNSESEGKTFLASDGEDMSTPDLIKHISLSLGYNARLFSAPLVLLNFLAFVLCKKKEIDRLTGSLRVDIKYTHEMLNWYPPLSVSEGIKKMIQKK